MRCPNIFCIMNYQAANGDFCIENQTDYCHAMVIEHCAALAKFKALGIAREELEFRGVTAANALPPSF